MPQPRKQNGPPVASREGRSNAQVVATTYQEPIAPGRQRDASERGILGAAPAMARRGWAVFPCLPRRKTPAVPDRWEQRAISDAERVARHWPSEKHNIGVACGPSRLVVVDCDTDAHGGDLPAEWRIPGVRDGLDVLMVLAEQAGVHLPDTYTVGTPTGGTHLYFRPPSGRTIGNSTGKAGPMVDARGAGGYVLAAGSVLDERAYPDRPEAAAIVKGGKTYEVLVDVDPAPLPDWLADLLDPPRKSAGYFAPIDAPSGDSAVAARLEAVVATVLDAQPGTRNNILHWATHRGAEMIAAGHLTEAQVRTCLGEAAMRIGLTPREAERTITSALCAVPLGGVA